MKNESNYTWWEAGIRSGWIEVYEREMIRFMEDEFGPLDDDVQCAAVFASLFLKDGHTALPLSLSPREWAHILGLDQDQAVLLPDEKPDIVKISQSAVVSESFHLKPLALHGDMLSFRKYVSYEDNLLQWIKEKNKNNYKSDINTYISQIFPDKERDEPDWQKIAAILSLIKPFLIISGGPGTGKTTTVARILVLHRMAAGKPIRVALAAPTGKAAGRMGEALTRELKRMNLPGEIFKDFPKEAKTVHRLLSGTEEHGLLPPVEKKELRYDLVIVDEASMIDLSLMHRLTTHLAEKTRLILLGDKDQLASVEAGAVFADLCRKKSNGFDRDTLALLKKSGIDAELPETEQAGLDDSIVYLTKSYRFGLHSGIGRLAAFVQAGAGESAELSNIFQKFSSELHQEEFSFQKEEMVGLIRKLLKKVEGSQTIHDPEKMLEYWKSSVWLAVLRRGLTGTERLNRLVEQQVAAERIVPMENGWYHGRPVIITQNDYNLGVFNGDAGVCIREKDDELWVYIESGTGFRRIKPQRLTRFEPGWFLTVHKSQGSEFDSVNLLLPKTWNPLITRELLYTAVTRARNRFSLFGSTEFFLKGIQNETVRFTGLKHKI
ncbi:MAG: exodeoxyribonuclease V subunit alpha [Balneolaceae bacterium]|nr:MAG: exodeoxyribonuclease V subunit alpha [Balneolaceae bacterium]